MKATCQICEREIKANTGLIAHHGYQRPGGGWQSASCWGARHLPYEKSCEQIQPCIDFIKTYVKRQQDFIKELNQNPPVEVTEVSMYSAPKTFKRPEDFDPVKNAEKGSYSYNTYEYAFNSKISTAQREIKHSQYDINRLTKRLANWKPL